MGPTPRNYDYDEDYRQAGWTSDHSLAPVQSISIMQGIDVVDVNQTFQVRKRQPKTAEYIYFSD
jgi:hypothetical protein